MHPFAQVARDLRKSKREEPLEEKRLSTLHQETRSPEPLASTTTSEGVFDLAVLDNMDREAFARGRLTVTMRSEILEDAFLLVPDSYVRKPGDPVAYTVKELEELVGLPAHLAKAAHSLKKKLANKKEGQ